MSGATYTSPICLHGLWQENLYAYNFCEKYKFISLMRSIFFIPCYYVQALSLVSDSRQPHSGGYRSPKTLRWTLNRKALCSYKYHKILTSRYCITFQKTRNVNNAVRTSDLAPSITFLPKCERTSITPLKNTVIFTSLYSKLEEVRHSTERQENLPEFNLRATYSYKQ